MEKFPHPAQFWTPLFCSLEKKASVFLFFWWFNYRIIVMQWILSLNDLFFFDCSQLCRLTLASSNSNWFIKTSLVFCPKTREWNFWILSHFLGNLHKVLSYFSVQRQLQAICLLQLYLTMDTASGSSKHYWQHLFYYGHYSGEICLRLLAFLQVIYPFLQLI